MTSESTILKRIRLAATRAGATLFRNNTGVAFYRGGQAVRFGLCEGSSDLIGYFPVRVADLPPDGIVAVFVAVEVKAPGSSTARARREKQANFLNHVQAAGGVAVLARSVDDVLEAISKAKNEETRNVGAVE